jgi:fucose 4-O-acetylase-like acetyltransferase
LFAFYRIVLGLDTKLQYINPFWSLWFLLTCAAFQFILPLINTSDKKKQVFILLGSVCAALLIGYVDFIGKVLSLSRVFVYFPWFLLGVYLRINGGFDAFFTSKKITMKCLVCSFVGCILSVLFMYNFNITDRMLYGSHPYSVSGQAIWVRGILMLITLSWIVLLCTATKLFTNKRIPLITYIGQCTLSIYLLHGYILKSIAHFCPVLVSKPLYVFLIAVILVFALGNNVLKKLVYYIGFSWLEKVVPCAGE